MDKIFVQVDYYAPQYNLGVENLDNVEEFKLDLSKDYFAFVRAHSTGRGGGIYEFFVNLFVNLTIDDYFKLIGGYLVGKTLDKIVDPILDRLLFRPLKEAYKRLKTKNPVLDWNRIEIKFLDTTICFYSIKEDTLNELIEPIIMRLFEIKSNLVSKNEYLPDFPYRIHVPVILDDKSNDPAFVIPNSELVDINEFNQEDYFRFWGLEYQFSYNICVFDLVNNCAIEDIPFNNNREEENF